MPQPLIVQVAFGTIGSPAVLRGVTKGNVIVVMTAFYRATGTGVNEALPTTSNPFSGAFINGGASRQPLSAGAIDFGSGIYLLTQPRCGGGDHTITPEANTSVYVTALEVQNLVRTISLLDFTGSAGSGDTTAHSELKDMAQNLAYTDASNELLLANCVVGAAVGSADIAFTDPPSGYTTLQKQVSDISDVAFMHCYQVVNKKGQYAVQFNWAAPLVMNSDTATLATLRGIDDAFAVPAISGGDLYL